MNPCPTCELLFSEWIAAHEFDDIANAEYLAMRAHQELCLDYQRWSLSRLGLMIFEPGLLAQARDDAEAKIAELEDIYANSVNNPV